MWNNSHRFLLNTGEDLMWSKLQERSSCKQVGQMGGGKQSGQNLHPWEGSVKEERFLHHGNPLQRLGDQQWKTGSFRGSEETAVAGCGRQNKQRSAQMVLATSLAVSRPRCMSVVLTGVWVLKLEDQWIDPGRDLRLAMQRQPEGARVHPRL